jgi:hypothetical protein
MSLWLWRVAFIALTLYVYGNRIWYLAAVCTLAWLFVMFCWAYYYWQRRQA